MNQITIETLEVRRLLSILPPSGLTVDASAREVPQSAANIPFNHLTFTDTSTTETGYRIEFSEDGVTWPGPGVPTDIAGTLPDVIRTDASTGTLIAVDHDLDTFRKLFYRVQTLETGQSPSAFTSPVAPSNVYVDRSLTLGAVVNGDGTVTINWEPSAQATTVTIYRKTRTGATWSVRMAATQYVAGTFGFVDNAVPAGSAFEYRVQVADSNGLTRVGFIYAGRKLELSDSPGNALLVVDEQLAPFIGTELASFKSDLIADGWEVQRIDVERDNESTANRLQVPDVLAQIEDVQANWSGGIQSIILIGHVPVPYAGLFGPNPLVPPPDGHGPFFPGQPVDYDHGGAWVADSYYGNLTRSVSETYTDDGEYAEATFAENKNYQSDQKWDNSRNPGGIDVPVGRIDFWNLPLLANSFPEDARPPAGSFELEAALMNRYFARDHEFRTTGRFKFDNGITQATNIVPRRAITDEHFNASSQSRAGAVYAALETIVGAGNVKSRDFTVTQQAVPQPVQNPGYLFAYGGGPGQPDFKVIAGVTQTENFSGEGIEHRSVFDFLFGSFVSDWDRQNDIMRAALGGKGWTLTTGWGGRPQWLLHTMALGETMGDALITTQNQRLGAGYYNMEETLAVQNLTTDPYGDYVNTSLLGDPTLRAYVLAAPSDALACRLADGTRKITWQASLDGVDGYRIYRADSADGPYELVSGTDLVQGTTFFDFAPKATRPYYLVRAVKSETTPSGTFQNLSAGAFAATGSSVDASRYNFEIFPSLTIQFSRDVSAALSADDLVLTKVGDETYDPGALALTYDPLTNVATFTFPNAPVLGGGPNPGDLADGNYRATISADDVIVNGEPLCQDATVDFFVLAGDITRDRNVTIGDAALWYNNFNTYGRNFTEGNFDYDADGHVDQDDFSLFSANFNHFLAPPPEGPGIVQASVLAHREIRLDWIDNVTSETGWRVQMSEDGQNFNWQHNISGDATSYTITDLEEGKRYWVRIRAYSDPATNPAGPNTAYTPKKSATTVLPASDELLAIAADPGSIQLTWANHAQNVSNIVVQRSIDLINWSDIVVGAGDQKYTDEGLTSGRTYYYRIIAQNEVTQSAPSIVRFVAL